MLNYSWNDKQSDRCFGKVDAIINNWISLGEYCIFEIKRSFQNRRSRVILKFFPYFGIS